MSVARTRKTGPKPSQEADLIETDSDLAESAEGVSDAAVSDSAEAPDTIAEELAPEDLTPDVTLREPLPASEAPIADLAAPKVKVERRGGFFPLLLGGIASGGIGFGAAAYLVPRYFPTSANPGAVAALEGELKKQGGKLTALDSALSDLRRAQEAQPAASAVPEAVSNQIAGIAARMDTLDQSVAALAERADGLDTRLAKAEQRPVTGDAASASALEAFQREMEAFRAEIAAQKQAVEAAKGDIATAAKAAATTIESVKADAEKIRSDAQVAAQKATISAAISRIEAALDSGGALSEPIAELTAAGMDVPVALVDQAQGVPTLAALRDSFPTAARMALTVSIKAKAGSDVWSRMTAFLRSQSGARSLTPRAGDEPDAVLSRAEANVRAGDLPNAIAELKALPDAGQAAMAEWAARADRRVQAVAAAATLKQKVE
jgi:hypothetical protein